MNRNKPSIDRKANRQLRHGEKPQGKPTEAEGNLHNSREGRREIGADVKDTKRSDQQVTMREVPQRLASLSEETPKKKKKKKSNKCINHFIQLNLELLNTGTVHSLGW